MNMKDEKSAAVIDIQPGRTRESAGRETHDPSLKKMPERNIPFTTVSGLPINNLYSPADIQDIDFNKEIGWPGEYPYTRGIHPTMYRSKMWTMRQFTGFGTAAQTNERLRYLVASGATGLSIAFRLPALMGIDSNNPTSRGEVGG